MPRLLLLAPAEITRDPRARRAAATALASGFDVGAVCGQASGHPPVPLDGVDIVRVGVRRAPLAAGVDPGRRAEPRLLREARGVVRLVRLATQTIRLVRGARRMPDPDVVHANDLDTLPAAWLVAARSRARLVYDAHELYSEFEADPPRVHAAVLRVLEGALARRAAAVVTVTPEIAGELERRLRLRERPHVVLNCPALADGEPGAATSGPLRATYLAAVGHTRFVSDVFDALEQTGEVVLALRVLGADRDALERAARARGLDGRVEVLEPVTPDGIVEALRGFDVGLVIDRRLGLNNELTVPNKLFEYLMAGLAVVVPRYRAMARIVEEDELGVTFEPGNASALAGALNALAIDRQRLRVLRQRARAAAVSKFNAEAQRDALLAAWSR